MSIRTATSPSSAPGRAVGLDRAQLDGVAEQASQALRDVEIGRKVVGLGEDHARPRMRSERCVRGISSRRGREVVLRLLALAGSPVELAEAKVAVGEERAHAARLGEGQGLAVVGLAGLGIEPVGMGRDVAEQVQRMGREPGLRRRGFDGAVAQAPRLVEPAEQQTGSAQRVVARCEWPTISLAARRSRSCSPSRSRFSASLASSSWASTQAEAATAQGSRKTRLPARNDLNLVFDQRTGFRPVALEEVDPAHGPMGRPDGERMLRRLGDPNRLGLVVGGLAEAAEFGEAPDQAGPIVDR